MTRTLVPAVGRLLADPRPDADLVALFLRDADHGAFAELVRRHGPLVLGVCRRTLGHAADADDAFQATFLVFVRRARHTAWRGSLGPWLYGVAVRVARKARAVRARRAAVERGAAMTAEPATTPPDRDDAAAVLDEELAALPEAVRVPLVLCELQGLSRKDAARQLGLAEGTLSSRLARGRKLLRGRLARRGVAPAVGGLCVAVPAELASATAGRAVAVLAGAAGAVPAGILALTDGVVKTMAASSWKLAAVAVAVGVGLTGFGGWRADGPGPGVGVATAADPPEKVAEKPKPPEVDPVPLRPRDAMYFGPKTSGDPKGIHFHSDWADHADMGPPESPRLTAVPGGLSMITDPPVATIFGEVPLSKEQFADHLIRRYGAKELEPFVNRQIVQGAFARKKLTVNWQEVEDAARADLTALNLTREQFERDVLPKSGKTWATWLEDVVAPRIMLTKLCAGRVPPPTEADLRRAFDAKYGEKVECRVIVWPADQADAAVAAEPKLRASEAAFFDAACKQPTAVLAVTAGRVPAIPRVPPPGAEDNPVLAAAAKLRPGEVGPLLEAPTDGITAGSGEGFARRGRGLVLVRCEKVIPADGSKSFEAERPALLKEVAEARLNRELPKLFAELKREAKPEYHLAAPGGKK